MTNLPLVPELVPEPLWGISAARKLGRKTKAWRDIRAEVLLEAADRCAACGFFSEGGRYQVCDELWTYDEGTGIATLSGLRILCPACDRARHFGMAGVLGAESRPEEHLMAVNGISLEEAEALLEDARDNWRQRNGVTWTVHVAPGLLTRFPSLGVVEGEIGRPNEGEQRASGRDTDRGVGYRD